MAFQFAKNCMDLIEVQNAYEAKFRKAIVSRARYGRPIVQAAHSAIGRPPAVMNDFPGIKKTLLAFTGNLEKREYFWFVPTYRKVLFDRRPYGGLYEANEIGLLVESLMVTIVEHQDALWELETNLAQILLAKLTFGFENICEWIAQGVPIDPENNEFIKLIDVERTNGQLRGGSF